MTPLAKTDLKLADLLNEFKKNQVGNTRIENKLADFEQTTNNNAANIKNILKSLKKTLIG